MGKKAKARQGSGAASGGAPAAARGDVLEYLPVLREHCPTPLSAEYDRMPPDAQRSMLAALKDYVRARLVELNMENIQDRMLAGLQHLGLASHQLVPRTSTQTRRQCSLAQLLRREFPAAETPPGHIDQLRRLLSSWGLEQPEYVMLLSHKRCLAAQKQFRDRMHRGEHYSQTTTSVARKGGSASGGLVDWDALQPITQDGLQLFRTATGRVLEGVTLAPPSCNVGMSVLVRDKSEQVTHVALYNQVPSGSTALDSVSYLNKKFPEGTRIAVAEPYYKVAADGTRMVRVDSPSEVRILSGGATAAPAQAQPGRSGQVALSKAAAAARQALSAHESETALQTAVDALRAPHNHSVQLACTLLNNRAQALLRAGHAAAALRDAAAVLMISPKQPKAWLRYAAALRALDAPAIADRAHAISGQAGSGLSAGTAAGPSRAAASSGWSKEVELARASDLVRQAVCAVRPGVRAAGGSGETAAQLKEEGNARYQAGQFRVAEGYYTRALLTVRGVDEIAALLTLLAEACLSSGSRHTAAAAAAACMRLMHVEGGTHKAVPPAAAVLATALLRLGEHATCRELLSAGAGAAECLQGCDRRSLLQDAGVLAQLMSESPDMRTLARLRSGSASDIVRHAKLVAIPGKGRGLVATRNLPPRTVVIVNPALVAATFEAGKGKSFLLSHNETHLFEPSQVALSSKAVHAASREPLVATTLLGLDDNGPRVTHRRPLPLVPLRSMQQLLSPRVLPLLPSEAEFFPVEERQQVSADVVDRVSGVNAHGNGKVGDSVNFSALFPVASLLNHSSDSNCEFGHLDHLFGMPGQRDGSEGTQGAHPREHVMVVFTNRGVTAGEELTVQYHADKAVVKRHWGL